ncbi:MAG: tyrosine-type recombinase/integrase [Coprothermobacterota bacterium]|nr:tyrosine-type recombinase/integrase [Coprothermobacterota bacterium]
MKRFLDSRERLDRSMRTIKDYEDAFRRFGSFLGGREPKSREDIEDFIDHLRKCPGYRGNARMSAESINTYLRALRALYKFVASRKYGKNFFDGISFLKTQERNFPILEDEQNQKVIDAARKTRQWQRDTAIVWILISTGIRAGELISMQIGNINLVDNTFVVNGKTGLRPVCLDKPTKKSIELYLRHRPSPSSPWLFQNSDGSRLYYGGLRGIIRRLEKATGIRLYLHLFRHSFATAAARAGATVLEIQELLGDKTQAAAVKYVHLNLKDLKKTHAKFTPTKFLH